jgi:iron complex transport system substrate-binding protein
MKQIRNLPLALTLALVVLGFAAVSLLFQSTPDRYSASRSLQQKDGPVVRRVICASPSITEIVFTLGEGARVVGVSDFSFYPPEAQAVQQIGGQINPNREQILSLEPDLIIFQGEHQALARFCREQDIPTLSVDIDRIDQILTAVQRIGGVLGAEVEAQELAAEIRQQLDDLARKTRALPPQSVFLGLGHTPGDLTGLMTTGSGTFLHELLELAGGRNIFADAPGTYPRISKEALVRRRPDVIIEVLAEGISPDNQVLLKSDWERLDTLPAVKAGRIHFLTDDYLLIPGVRVAQTANRLAAAIHPELFEEYRD